MKRLTIHLIVALLTFIIGVAFWFVNPARWIQSHPNEMPRGHATTVSEPLRVSITSTNKATDELSKELGFQYEIHLMLENMSDKTIRGYMLRHVSDCGTGGTVPHPDKQILQPGETQFRILRWCGSNIRIWTEFVNFDDQTRWGWLPQNYEKYMLE